jgi:VIT1/CCC1 family predicted Fe2+/Mn2+ transporter
LRTRRDARRKRAARAAHLDVRADIIAALVPVSVRAAADDEARYVSLAATAAALVVLGIGRAKIGKRPCLSTTFADARHRGSADWRVSCRKLVS